MFRVYSFSCLQKNAVKGLRKRKTHQLRISQCLRASNISSKPNQKVHSWFFESAPCLDSHELVQISRSLGMKSHYPNELRDKRVCKAGLRGSTTHEFGLEFEQATRHNLRMRYLPGVGGVPVVPTNRRYRMSSCRWDLGLRPHLVLLLSLGTVVGSRCVSVHVKTARLAAVIADRVQRREHSEGLVALNERLRGEFVIQRALVVEWPKMVGRFLVFSLSFSCTTVPVCSPRSSCS